MISLLKERQLDCPPTIIIGYKEFLVVKSDPQLFFSDEIEITVELQTVDTNQMP